PAEGLPGQWLHIRQQCPDVALAARVKRGDLRCDLVALGEEGLVGCVRGTIPSPVQLAGIESRTAQQPLREENVIGKNAVAHLPDSTPNVLDRAKQPLAWNVVVVKFLFSAALRESGNHCVFGTGRPSLITPSTCSSTRMSVRGSPRTAIKSPYAP